MNVTVTNPTAISDPIIEAIEAATAARREDACCQADAMLQIYGFEGTSSSSATSGGTVAGSTDVGSQGNSLPDGSGTECLCEEITVVRTVNVANESQSYSFTYNTCEGKPASVESVTTSAGTVFTFPEAEIEATCFPADVDTSPDCCKDISYEIDVYDGRDAGLVTGTIPLGLPYSAKFTVEGNSCQGMPDVVEYVETDAGGTPTIGFCLYRPTLADPYDPNVYADITDTSFVTQDSQGAGDAVCSPYVAGQPLFPDATGDPTKLYYQPIAKVISGFDGYDCTEIVDCSTIPCDIFGRPIPNYGGQDICCACKQGQEVGTKVVATNCWGQPLYVNPDDPTRPYVRTFDDDGNAMFVPDNSGPAAPNSPAIVNYNEPVEGQTLEGLFWLAVIYECDPCVEEESVLDILTAPFTTVWPNKEVECGEPGNLAESYHQMWCEWLKCQADYQNWMKTVYGAQAATGLWLSNKSLSCLNDILSLQKDIVENQVNDNSLLAACSEALIGTDGILKKCQDSLLEGYVARLGILNTQSEAICERGDDLWDCYAQSYGQIPKQLAEGLASTLYDIIQEGGMTVENTADWASTLDSTFLECFMPEMKREFQCILDSANHSAVNLNDWRDQKRADARAMQHHYEQRFKCGEATMIPAIMDMTQCMVEKVCEIRDYLHECGKGNIQDQECFYRDGELVFARDTLDAADDALPRLVEALQWWDRNIHAYKELADCYADDERKLSTEIFNDVTKLAPQIANAYCNFEEQRHEYRQFWENCWKDRQCRLVKTQLDLACKLTECIEDGIEKMICWADEADKRYDWYGNAERQNGNKPIWAGGRSVDNLEESAHIFDEWRDQFRDIMDNKIIPCDLKDLQKVCDIWTKTNMVEEIHRNTDDVRDMAILSRDAYEKSVLYAQDLLKDIAQEESFEYCIEEAAYLHVREQFERAQEEIVRCNSRYCSGFMAEALARLKFEQAKAEGGAYESAQRWKWWANEQLQRKRYDQSVGLFGLFQGYGEIALSGYNAANAGNELLLSTVSNSINRVYTYIQQMQGAAAGGVGVDTAMVNAMQQMIQMGHFWPQHALTTQQAAMSAKQAVLDDAQALLQQGNFFVERETWSTLNGSNYLNNMMGTGIQSANLGHFWAQEANKMNQIRQTGNAALVQQGQTTVGLGHELHKMGTAKVAQSLESSISAGNVGLSAAELGQRYAAQSLNSQADCINNALDHMKLAAALIDSGISFMGEVRDSYANSNLNGVYAQQNLLNLFQEGRQTASQTAAFQELCFKQQFDLLCKGKDYAQKNYEIISSRLHGNSLQGINQLARQLNDTFEGGLGDLFSGVSSIGLTNSTPPSLPYGGASIGGSSGGIF